MTPRSPEARRLPIHHITIRVPWHDDGWTGNVCKHPLNNTSCLILRSIGEGKRDEVEARCSGKRLDQLAAHEQPPCIGERVSFMAPFDLTRTMCHPYSKTSPETHGHFGATRLVQPSYSAACVPFRWMLRREIEGSSKDNEPGLAERLQIGWVPDREPDLGFDTAWAQERDNQLNFLDTFFGALRPKESLCFFYAKRTPLSEQSQRVIVGVGRVLSVGRAVEYAYKTKTPPLRSVLWERNVGHSIRPGFADGFLFPYQELMVAATRGEISNPEEFVAFAPDGQFGAFSYGCEHLTHDGAVASLVACAAALHRIRGRIEGRWDSALRWVDSQLNRTWRARGAYPGLGSALSAFGYEWGFQHGSLLAYEVELQREKTGYDAWAIVDGVMEEPNRLTSPLRRFLTPGLRKAWKALAPDRRTLLDLLGRCAINEQQALRVYDRTWRKDAGIDATDVELIANPYLFFERDRRNADPIPFGAVDRGLFPDEAIRRQFPMAEPARVNDPVDSRRVRAFVIDLLKDAASEGHSILPQIWVIRRARTRSLQPPCPLGENVLETTEPSFQGLIHRVATGTDEPAYQLDHLVECRRIIRREVRGRRKGRRHIGEHNWRVLVDRGIGQMLPRQSEEREIEERARWEKSAALEQIFRSRLSILVGPAGTGKTTLLKMLCNLTEVSARGVLLLAPTGKARVRLEEQTEQRGSGQTLAQFLIHYSRYNGETSAYFANRNAPRCSNYRTVVVDECSMLTEDQLAALFDACINVERYVLVGDPRQLPPIGTGRPFVDIVNELAPDNLEGLFPKCSPCYAELTIPRRQTSTGGTDVLLASHFSGLPLDPGADEVWDTLTNGESDGFRAVQWSDPRDLTHKMQAELIDSLGLKGPEDELGFELSLGGSRFSDLDRAFFWSRFRDNPGAALMVEQWQILSPIRGGIEGVDALNRAIQERFRGLWRAIAEAEGWKRTIPKPLGQQGILYGDKVINVVNQRRRDVFPKPPGEAYIANGDLGVVVGQYKTKKFKGLPWKLEVEFAGQLGFKYGFRKWEFGDEATNPLELAYALTVHKTQGSEFSITLVVLPNPCWLLSRELLYTALTRHKNRLVILHQGPLTKFRRFASDEHSEIARRMTNLFTEARPREIGTGANKRFLEDGLIHRTERGDLVRSKSELVIADKLYARGITYGYEQMLVLPDGRSRYPDFTISDDLAGITYYWEHLGLLGDPSYRARWERKKKEYETAAILPYQHGGGSGGTLIETRDDPSGRLNANLIAQIIDTVLIGDG